MNDEQAGKFIKAIYEFQISGKLPELDFAIEMAVTPFVNQFKRDCDKWSKECKTRSDNGRMGNLKRWNYDLYQKVTIKEITLEEAENIANHRKASPPDSNPIDPDRKGRYNVSKSESDNVSKSDNDSNLKKRGKKFSPPSISELENYCNEKGKNVDAEAFINFYQQKGWMVGKNKMKDWRAAINLWDSRSKISNTTHTEKKEGALDLRKMSVEEQYQFLQSKNKKAS
jgi:hypothetical protein